MKKMIEKSYAGMLRNIFRITNPIKKKVIRTECRVHKFINNQAVIILKNDGHFNEYAFFVNHIKELNAGVVWADQDYKSINHFYNPELDKGMYGFSNAHSECMHYYTKALTRYFEGDEKGAMFYLGAACHLIQDVTVPQHVNIKLLKHHRKYEQWVIKVYEHHNEFKAARGGIYLESVKEFVEFNTSVALDTYDKYKNEPDLEKRFYETTLVVLVTAQKTTAGFLLDFYRDLETLKLQCDDFVENRLRKTI